MTEIAIYQTPSGEVEVRLEPETVWLRMEQMAELFGRDRTVVGRHVRNVFADEKLHVRAMCKICTLEAGGGSGLLVDDCVQCCDGV